ncbi:hypothetical protein BUALT_Bualt02G0113100 [Buddleja alternifolia]|uniref:PUB domain-containing protein n=1 Tax=Buddleja alternifolia TaxID=168488 RepID=A0AAV6Y1H2_9LAMI|nr:hypothetical protein BUALT_Bualt02G0113100 [Buddleja alternifolia]
MSSQSTNYRVEEDIHLCHLILDISQDPITSINQTKNKLWNRGTQLYNESKDVSMKDRILKSLESHFKAIEKAVQRLIQCIKKVELYNPRRASEQDILQRAKLMFVENVQFKDGFKFDHVWNMLKDVEKFLDNDTTRSQVEEKIGKQREKDSNMLDEEIKEMMKNAEAERLQLIELQQQQLHEKQQQRLFKQQQAAVKQRNIDIARDDRILEKALSSISDPTVRAHY